MSKPRRAVRRQTREGVSLAARATGKLHAPMTLQLIGLGAVGVAAVLVLTAAHSSHPRRVEKTSDHPAAQPRSRVVPGSYHELLALSPEALAEVDIALVNLVCARGLPGAEGLDIPAVLTRLDEWAERVRSETERHLYRLRDPQWAEHYRKSESYLRVEFLLQVLQEDCGARYNHERIRDPDFRNSEDLFLHGLVDNDNGGTCVSMPVLYVAVGRRLGYPVYLVLAKRHVFCRWDDGHGDRFNFDGAGAGIASEPDEYYRAWPAPISEEEIARGEYLKSLTPVEELGLFLGIRGHPLFDCGRLDEARAAYAAACRLMPQSQDLRSFLEDTMRSSGRQTP